jgi:hypothetical protein
MRINFIIIIVTFLCGNIVSQKWNIYSNIDSVGNVIKPYKYITEKEIVENFNLTNFNIENFSIENMSILPMQVVSKDKINLERVPFYEGHFSDISELYFIGKIAIKDDKLSHYIFANVLNKIHTKYFLFNYYKGKLSSVLEICSKTTNVDFPEFSYRLNSKFNSNMKQLILNFEYDDDIFNEIKKVGITDKGFIKLI